MKHIYRMAVLLGVCSLGQAIAAQAAYRPQPADPPPPPPRQREIELGSLVYAEASPITTRVFAARTGPAPVVPGFPLPALPPEYATPAQGPNRRQRRWLARQQQKK